MSGEANILRGRCKHECATTWAVEHGPGWSLLCTPADEGDVRRCEHGRIWKFAYRPLSGAVNHWRLISWWFEPIVYVRAKRALRSAVR